MDNLELYAFAHRGGGGITPTGTIEITDTELTDVSAYANAQVVDANLVAENIKKDVEILGTTGTYEGGGILKIVTWADGTDEEIVAMLQAHYDGLIDIHDYWTIGDERTVSLGAIPSSGVANGVAWNVSESQSAQTVTMVLMDTDHYDLVSGGKCAFVVGQKNGLTTKDYINSQNETAWIEVERRPWCNGGYWDAIPPTLRPIFKQFKLIWNTQGLTISDEYFSLFAEKEIFGASKYAVGEQDLSQISYYATAANRIKKTGDSGSAEYWWERSPYGRGSNSFCIVSSSGDWDVFPISSKKLLAPFGCI